MEQKSINKTNLGICEQIGEILNNVKLTPEEQLQKIKPLVLSDKEVRILVNHKNMEKQVGLTSARTHMVEMISKSHTKKTRSELFDKLLIFEVFNY